jgi:DNA polymerase I-like protein with 3'-5' exonuclease and polymerase domains
MSIVIFDFEGTTFNVCNVYDERTWVNLLSIKVISEKSASTLSFTKPWDVGRIREILDSATLLIGFNIKFDLAWARREFGFIPKFGTRIYDPQYVEYLFSNQTWRFPDLRTACIKRNVQAKMDHIKENYWDKGIDTDQIPMEELIEYCEGDVESTYQLYEAQMKLFQTEYQHLYRLFRLHMLDLPVLLEMEWNGLKYNHQRSLELANEYDEQIKNIETKLNNAVDFEVNWNSSNEKSAILYGGTISRDIQVPIGHFKTGARAGQVKYKKVERLTEFPQLVKPLTTYKDGQKVDDTSTAEPVLRSLKPNKFARHIIDLILERAKLEKMNGTYLKGLPKKLIEMGWGDALHPSYNQCVTVTGRVASSAPNGQNIPPVGKRLCESRF